MAISNILQRYGIKEVADVTFYDINNDGSVGKPVLVLDSLKVTSIEQTAETTEADIILNLLASFTLLLWKVSEKRSTLPLKALPLKLLCSKGFEDVLFCINGDFTF